MNDVLNKPNDYLSQVNYDLQTTLGIKDTKLISSGALSVLANLLSNIAFDAQKYYEYIVKEFNVATARQFKSMLFHASVYSYDFNLALPASVTAYLEIPKTTISTDKKIKYAIPAFSSFKLNNAIFRINGEIDIEITSNSFTAIMKENTNIYQLDVLESVNENNNPVYYVVIPSDKVTQLERLVEKFVAPDYGVGENVTFNIAISQNNQIYRMKAFVNKYTNPPLDSTKLETIPFNFINNYYSQLEEFELKYFKFNSTLLDKVIFANFIDHQNINFTLGNSLYGYKLDANDEVFIVVEYCKGIEGNVVPGISQLENILYYEINTITSDTTVFNTINVNIKTKTPATGGANTSDIEDIRFGILKKITERNSLITQLDFEKYFANPTTKQLATVISRQIDTSSPMITVYNILHDPYTFEILKTVTLNKSASECFSTDNWCINPTVNYNDIDMVSPFIYIKHNNQIWSYYKYENIKIPLTIVEIRSNPELSPNLYVKWDNENENFYYESDNLGTEYKIEIDSNVGNYVLDSSNDFKAVINNSNMIYDRFFNSNLVINNVKIIKQSTDFIIHIYNVTSDITVMKKIQRHKEYTFSNGINKILFIPFITIDHYNKFQNDAKYINNFINYFNIADNDVRNKLAFNMFLNQGFMNTIGVDEVTASGVQINDNDELVAKYPITIDVLCDLNVLNSAGLTLFNLKNDIQLAVLEYLNSIQGNSIEHYVTTLIKTIKSMFPKIILEVEVSSPKTLVVNKWNEILENGTFTADSQLESVPTYFHFDINNMQINFKNV